ncbi:MAG: hypothetical protein HUK00_02810 [Bacteroidaceae bacterium]|nr:hypothetical protein [Bacteroidaceae bacterium]
MEFTFKHIGGTTARVLCMASLALLTACDDTYTTFNDGSEPTPGGGGGGGQIVVEKLNTPSQVRPTSDGIDATWSSEKAAWEGQYFRMYALRIPNYANREAADWTRTDDRLSDCDGDTLRLRTDGSLAFTDGKSHINDTLNPEHRYIFYAACTGKADVKDPVIGAGSITQKITLDGRQNIAMGVSYSNEADIDNFIKKINTASSDYSLSFRLLTSHRGDICYSNVTGYRNLQPIVHMKQLLTEFEVNLRGAYAENAPKTPSYRNFVITGIEISAPYSGTLTLAKSSWTSQAAFMADVNADKVLTPDGTSVFKPMPTLTQPTMTKEQSEDYWNACVPLIKEFRQQKGEEYSEAEAKKWWHVNNLQYAQLATGILLPRSNIYDIRVSYYYVDRKFNSESEPDAQVYDRNGEKSGVATYQLKMPLGQEFKINSKYKVNITAYNFENLLITVESAPKK